MFASNLKVTTAPFALPGRGSGALFYPCVGDLGDSDMQQAISTARAPAHDSYVLSTVAQSTVVQAARRLFEASPYLPLRGISCDHHEGALVLRGALPSYYLKQMAQESVVRLPGVLEIHNRIEVSRPEPPAPAEVPPGVSRRTTGF